ncbi:hypothetical protein EVAR_81091_1 [Eumeta japonica]|uniref:Uncharacterized protein n=1 Tax=Eumeta variegata TaxID=151549 RepID=A0A4C1T8E6_EUMVA|nr:hypothetical protein EVAR_81091_1 [Eumeta japonica]
MELVRSVIDEYRSAKPHGVRSLLRSTHSLAKLDEIKELTLIKIVTISTTGACGQPPAAEPGLARAGPVRSPRHTDAPALGAGTPDVTGKPCDLRRTESTAPIPLRYLPERQCSAGCVLLSDSDLQRKKKLSAGVLHASRHCMVQSITARQASIMQASGE